jgi:methylmalonyl-CoA/ethylmalonyl-CoA epimerase
MDNFAFHHVGVAVRDLRDSILLFKNLFGYELLSGLFDDPIQNVSVCFLSRGKGDPLIELVAPLGPHSPIDLTLKKGGGTYHICQSGVDLSFVHTSGNPFPEPVNSGF